jgi:hypothetical protein
MIGGNAMARNVSIRGTITRVIDSREIEIQFTLDVERGGYHQWGQNTKVLGDNVDLMEAIVEAVADAE